AVSASYLYNFCKNKAPKKYFSIGKVYRNEATDYKHLAEFFQVEGIVVWEGATFRDLLGCLKEFYSKLGFEKIRFQPSYFPYTEPSLEISVYFEKKQQWLELGGAGIFRPEVSIPLCDRYPVLAWGLSLERPLMLLNDMDDIRDFYRSNVGWIRRQKIQ
ncbi:MAG: phenylalanine--tRNA ligase subunit alpha, partial [Candidatus Micrarchaeota archaeon]|nr:phenylalanine--tRNA ligase subunit alpha [Candidatus Micrarchaeota archaeon]